MVSVSGGMKSKIENAGLGKEREGFLNRMLSMSKSQPLFLRRKKLGLEKIKTLPKFTQPIASKGEIYPKSAWF